VVEPDAGFPAGFVFVQSIVVETPLGNPLVAKLTLCTSGGLVTVRGAFPLLSRL
jgi:hypothetical protein